MPRSTQTPKALGDEKMSSTKSHALHHSLVNGANNLEKSKSDSKLDQFAHHSNLQTTLALTKEEDTVRRSNSNQHIERKSPTKKKKAKSYSKLSELDKEVLWYINNIFPLLSHTLLIPQICPDTGQVIDHRQSSSDLDTPSSIKKLKAKSKQPRLRMSPKKSRPQDLRIVHSEPNAKIPIHSKIETNTTDTPDGEYQDEEPKSAPLEYISKTHIEGLIFQYQDVCEQEKLESTANSASSVVDSTGFSILEKCIRQYEIFFEVYLSYKVLQIRPHNNDACSRKCSAKLQENRQETVDDVTKIPNVENIFKNEEVYEDTNPYRLFDVDNLFDTLRILVVNRSRQLHSLLNRSLRIDSMNGLYSEGTDGSDNNETDDNYVELDEDTKTRLQSLLELHLSQSLRNAIKLAVNLLVEMSTFPNCNKNITLDKAGK